MAIAMILDRPLDEILQTLGHDGSEILWSNRPEPKNRRGHGIQECIDLALSFGVALVDILANPVFDDGTTPVFSEEFGQQRFNNYLNQYDGLLYGVTATDTGHVLVWKDQMLWNPGDGKSFPVEECPITVWGLWIVIKSMD